MNINPSKFFRIYYSKVTESIAFYPAIIAIGFLLLSWVMIEIDFSTWGKNLKSGINLLSLKDASTARSIISTIAGAVLSLTVFSFSMVMIVLNQAASQMSNRVLSSMISNRFQQIVLGFYIGTIVYALFLLSTIRDVDSGIYIPALSIYLLILMTVIDIFLFIYFLEYVTQTVKYETIINRVKDKTMDSMKEKFESLQTVNITWQDLPFRIIKVNASNYFQSTNQKKMLEIATSENLHISILQPLSSYLLKDTPLIKVYSKSAIKEEVLKEISMAMDFYSGQPIDRNADYGFRQLAEIAIKALSPGINDPGTAIGALYALSDLFSYRLYCSLPEITKDAEKITRIYAPASSFEQLFEKCIYPIWNYGKKDQYIQTGLLHIIEQLKIVDTKKLYSKLFDNLSAKIQLEIEN